MNRVLLLGVSLLVGVGAFGQHSGGGGGGGGRGGHGGGVRPAQAGTSFGYGNVINPGGAAPGSTYGYGNIIYPGGVTAFPGGIHNEGAGPPPLGLRGGPGYGSGGYGHGGNGYGGKNRTIVVPYGVPVWNAWGYGYYGYYDNGDNGYYPDQVPPNVSVVVPQQPTPQVIINQGYVPDVARPVLKDYSDAELPEASPTLRVYDAPTGGQGQEPAQARRAPDATPRSGQADDKPTIFLIALKDSTVRAAIGFWTQGNTLNYVTPQGDVNHLSMDMLDRATTDQLNRERGLDFELKTVY